MTTTIDAINIVWHKLNDSAVKTSITGGVYKGKRPQNSKSEDVVVNSLPINFEQLQEGVLNVNIHVPNLIIISNSSQDNTQPDFVRLETLTDMAIQLLYDVWADGYHFNVQQQTIMEEPELNEHFVNIRLEFYAANI